MAAEGYDDRFILDRQHRRLRVFRPGGQIGDGGSLLPLGHGLLVDAVTLGELPQALLTMLYRSTDRLRRRGAPVKNLSHSASFDSCDNGAPSKPGIKHLIQRRVISTLLQTEYTTRSKRTGNGCSSDGQRPENIVALSR